MRITSVEIAALTLSVKVALLSLIIMLPPGLFFGWLLVKRDFIGKTLLNTIVMSPLVLPPVVSGYLLLILLSKQGPIGSVLYRILKLEIVFSPAAVVIAVSIISFPLLIRGIMAGVASVPVELENAARTLGSNPFKVFITITLPLSYKGILGGVILGFTKSLGEFGATYMIAGNIPGKTQTIALSIFDAVQLGNDTAVFRLVLISTIIAFIGIWVTERYIYRHQNGL